MPDFMPGIHILAESSKKAVDGRDKPGHDEQITQRKKNDPHPLIIAAR
jgi:hypothetical protein